MAIVTSVETTETRTIIKFHKKGDINQTKIFFQETPKKHALFRIRYLSPALTVQEKKIIVRKWENQKPAQWCENDVV